MSKGFKLVGSGYKPPKQAPSPKNPDQPTKEIIKVEVRRVPCVPLYDYFIRRESYRYTPRHERPYWENKVW